MSHEFGTGYPGFRAAIDAVADALGGGPVRPAVARDFVTALYGEIALRTNEKYGVYGVAWTSAIDADFDQAVEKMLTWARRGSNQATDATAPWNGVRLLKSDVEVALVGGGYRIPVAMTAANTRPDRLEGVVTTWQVFLTDTGERFASGSEAGMIHGISSPKSTHAKSAAGASKSLARMVETFFKVKFEYLEESV